jgi:NAD(P)-dependent dehydrogenase (short-subunit alcohol dehydrogenase family)
MDADRALMISDNPAAKPTAAPGDGELKDCVALVTGGTRGIGWAVCEALARHGAAVVTCGSTAESVRQCEQRARELGLAISPLLADVEKEDAVDMMVRETVERHGRLNILVPAAGRAFRGAATDTTVSDWDRCLSLNLRAPFLIARAALPHLIRSGESSIVFVSSIWAVTATYRRVAYTVAKSGLTDLARALAIDHAGDGVRVNAVAPGYVDTDLLRRSLSELNPGRPVDQLLAAAADDQPLKRLSRPEEIGELVAFLVGPHAPCITGQTLVVDSGITTKYALAERWK